MLAHPILAGWSRVLRGQGFKSVRITLVSRLNANWYSQWRPQFGVQLAQLLDSAREVLVFGAGRGAYETDLRAPHRRVVGADVSPAVLENTYLDEARVYDGVALPFERGRFDLCLARWVTEHLPDPAASFREIARVLRPGGRFVFVTSNRWYYVYLAAAIIPNGWHAAILRRLLGRDERDTFPTYYRANSRRRLRALLREAGFCEDHCSVEIHNVGYMKFSLPTFLLAAGYERLLNGTAAFEDLRQAITGVFRRVPHS